MKKHSALIGLLCTCGFLSAQEAPAPNAPNAPDTAAKNHKVQKVKRNRPQNRGQNIRITRLKENTAKIIAKFDADKDGRLSPTEKAVMEKTFEEAREIFMLSVAYRNIQAVDENGDMILSENEIQNAPAKLREIQEKRKQQIAERHKQRQMKKQK